MGRFEGILIASDFDRTLTDPNGMIPQRNRDALRFFMEEGGRFCAASGRSVPMFRQKNNLFPSNAPAILFNGAACYDFQTDKLIFGTPLPDMTALIREALKRYPLKNCEMQGVNGHTVYRIEQERAEMFRSLGVPFYDASDTMPEDPMYMLFLGDTFIRPDDTTRDFQSTTPEVEQMFTSCIAWLEQQGSFSAIRSTRRNTEVMVAGVTKGTAARKLAKLLGCKTLVCAGDAMNDLAMLTEADYSFTPADGDHAIREILGDRLAVVCPCEKGTLADVIDRLMEII